jgi:hypothetical protein
MRENNSIMDLIDYDFSENESSSSESISNETKDYIKLSEKEKEEFRIPESAEKVLDKFQEKQIQFLNELDNEKNKEVDKSVNVLEALLKTDMIKKDR